MTKILVPGARTVSSALTSLVLMAAITGCRHDPNVQKEKYLESGKRYAADAKYKEAAIQFSNAPAGHGLSEDGICHAGLR